MQMSCNFLDISTNRGILLLAETAAVNYYCLYGLTVSTPFPCPELVPSLHAPDVVVQFEQIDDSGVTWGEQGVCYNVSPGRYLLSVKGVARYLLSEGTRISIEKGPDADEDSLRLFFYNEVAAALLMQRGMLVLKASVVARNGRAFVLAGKASIGKSFTAAGLARKGYAIVSEGVCVISIQNGGIAVSSGFPALMLWEKGLRALDLSPEQYRPVRKGMNKFYFPVTENFVNETLPVSGICLLSEHNKQGISSCDIEGASKLFALLNHQYHPGLPQPMGVMGNVNELAAITAKRARLRKIEFNMSASPFGDYIDYLERELEKFE